MQWPQVASENKGVAQPSSRTAVISQVCGFTHSGSVVSADTDEHHADFGHPLVGLDGVLGLLWAGHTPHHLSGVVLVLGHDLQ